MTSTGVFARTIPLLVVLEREPSRCGTSGPRWLRLCNSGPLQPVALRGVGPGFHTNLKLCTGVFKPPVGDVGNWCPLQGPYTRLSKHPEFHSPVLENWPHPQISPHQYLRKVFHFSCHNYGDYCLFFYIPIFFHTSVAPPRHLATQPYLADHRLNNPHLCFVQGSSPKRPITACNPEFGPLFHPHL